LLCSAFALMRKILWWLPINYRNRKKLMEEIHFYVKKCNSNYNICQHMGHLVRSSCETNPVLGILHSRSSKCLELPVSESVT
jgi:hypothetical protein